MNNELKNANARIKALELEVKAAKELAKGIKDFSPESLLNELLKPTDDLSKYNRLIGEVAVKLTDNTEYQEYLVSKISSRKKLEIKSDIIKSLIREVDSLADFRGIVRPTSGSSSYQYFKGYFQSSLGVIYRLAEIEREKRGGKQ